MKINLALLEVVRVLANNFNEENSIELEMTQMSLEEAKQWKQPTYWDAYFQSGPDDETDRWRPWGHPVGIRAAASWNLCPDIELPEGVASLR